MRALQVVLVLTYILPLVLSMNLNRPCAARKYGSDSVVCVCNSTYCDTISSTPPVSAVPLNSVRIFQSTKSGQRFNFHTTQLINSTTLYYNNSVVISVNPSKSYQSIKGFGGAITDAATINIKSLSPKTQHNLVSSYYASTGIEYNLGRVPIASCDYSTREYTYLDAVDDFNLTTFALAKEDLMYKIPVINTIFNVSKKTVYLYASPWTAPAWMKTNNHESGWGWLKGQAGDKYHKTWAQYFVRFFDEYAKHGIKFWGVTAQNEPSNGLLVPSQWQSLGFTPETQRDFIKTDLGPALMQSAHKEIELMILDDQRIFLPNWAEIVLQDPEAAKYVSGIGIHWYWNDVAGPELLTATHDKFPKTFLLATEACNKDTPKPDLGNWKDGVKYSSDIIDNLNHWACGWVDWNMALDLSGGPNWAKNFDDSPIIVNKTADEFYKQPMFYHLGHFSKFLPEGSVIIHSETESTSNLKFTSAVTPFGEYVLVVLNQSPEDVPTTVSVAMYQYSFMHIIPGNSIVTFAWPDGSPK